MSITLILATTNQNKIRELKKLIADHDQKAETLSLNDFGVKEAPEENGLTFLDNSIIKADFYSKLIPDLWVVAEDSGLVVDILGGKPGMMSARYAGPDADDSQNIKKLLLEMDPHSDRRAGFVTCITVSRNGQSVQSFRGEVKGEITREPRGSNGFGYDPVFYYPPYKKTFAEISLADKNQISHRSAAFQALVAYLPNLTRPPTG